MASKKMASSTKGLLSSNFDQKKKKRKNIEKANA